MQFYHWPFWIAVPKCCENILYTFILRISYCLIYKDNNWQSVKHVLHLGSKFELRQVSKYESMSPKDSF